MFFCPLDLLRRPADSPHPVRSPPVPPYLVQSALNLDQARPYPRILVASGPVLVGSLPYYRMSLDSWSGSRRARACGVTTSFADYIVVLLLLLSLPKPRFRNLGFGKLFGNLGFRQAFRQLKT